MEAKKEKIKKKISGVEKKLKAVGPVMRGSIVLLKVNCGNKSCKCYKNKKDKHPAYYFSVNINKKTKMIYLGEKRVQIARSFNNNYHKLRDIIDEMTELTLELTKLS